MTSSIQILMRYFEMLCSRKLVQCMNQKVKNHEWIYCFEVHYHSEEIAPLGVLIAPFHSELNSSQFVN